MKKRLASAAIALAGVLAAIPAASAEGFHYDETSVRPATYFAALSNLASAVMFSGAGEKLIFSMYERDNWLRRVGYVTRPPMPDVKLVGAVYAGADPRYVSTPDYSDTGTLRWNADTFDRTLEPSAHAWTLLKITAPLFHQQFHDLRQNKIAGLMMIPQARAEAKVLNKRLVNGGLFAPLGPDGRFGTPRAIDQAAVLWAASSLIAAATDGGGDYWHEAYGDLTDPADARPLADTAFVALTTLPPRDPAARAIAIEALGRYALVTPGSNALQLAREQAEALAGDPGDGIWDVSLAVYGLTEAARLLDAPGYAQTAQALFSEKLLPLWSDEAGAFVTTDSPTVYTPKDAGAVVAALNAMRWYGQGDASKRAAALYPAFFEGTIVGSGMLLASPLPLVAAKYLETTPPEHFAHPSLPDPAKAGVAPIFAAEVTWDNGWNVTDQTFRTGPAMFLANMLALQSDGEADTFLPASRLAELR